MGCSKCGSALSSEARFCPKCGASVETSSPQGSIAIWNPDAAACWSLALSAIFGAYLQAKNWKTLGESGRAKAAWAWFWISIVFYLLSPFISAATQSMVKDEQGILLSWGYLLVWYFSSGRSQAKYVKNNFGPNYPRRGWGVPLLIGFAIKIAAVAVVALLAAGNSGHVT